MMNVAQEMKQRGRWSPLEIAFWLIAAASIWLLPGWHLILTEVAILGLFALSLDLILGYAGILSLGHAAFFGIGAYTAGLLAKHGIVTEPVLALLVSGVAATMLGFGDVAGKYYVPQFGAFIIYVIMIVVLIWRPQGLFARSAAR